MTKFIIRLMIEGGIQIDHECKTISEYAMISAQLEEKFPNKHWREERN